MARVSPHEVGAGDDADKLPAAYDGQSLEAMLLDEATGLFQRRGLGHRHRIGSHDVADRTSVKPGGFVGQTGAFNDQLEPVRVDLPHPWSRRGEADRVR